MTRRKRAVLRYTNHRVEDQGRSYRVTIADYGRCLGVWLRCPAGGERFVNPLGRRGLEITRLVP